MPLSLLATFSGQIRASSGPIGAVSGPIGSALKGPFLAYLAPFGPRPRLLSPRLDFPDRSALGLPKDPAVLKTLRDSELLRRSVFTTPPRCTTMGTLERKNVCNSQEDGVRTRCAAIVNQYAIVNLLRRAKFTTA